jgi:outer membrane lipoprotein SlyB
VTVEGRRFAVRADSSVVGTVGRDRDIIDSRTGQSAIAGAVVGSIIGAIAGGGKGAAIGAGVGAAAGAGARIATRGRNIDVPSDTVLTFRLTRPIYIDVADDGYDRDGFHYHRYQHQ